MVSGPLSEEAELERRLRFALEELSIARAELAAARADLQAMALRVADLSPEAEIKRSENRQIASDEFIKRRQREVARHELLLRLARPLRESFAGPTLERTYHRLRTWRS